MLLVALQLACGGRGPSSRDQAAQQPPVQNPPDQPTPPPPPPTEPIFQPGFHEALRWSHSTGALTTYRFRIPIGRAGSRVKVSIRAGDGPVRIARATVGRSQGQGRLTEAPVALTFAGAPSVAVSSARGLAVSDPVEFPVQFHEELYVSFAAEGALAASAIFLFPDSYAVGGDRAGDLGVPTGTPQHQLVGLTTIDVEGPPGRAFVAIGDSITEGYIEGGAGRPDDYRQSWPFVAESQLSLPVVNAAVSGQGVYEELYPESRLEQEVLSLQGITDCLVLLGTNDLGTGAADIQKNLGILFTRLAPFCRVWAATTPPKERDYVFADRAQVNDWIRKSADLEGYVELDPLLGSPPDHNTWLPGLTVDGIHPTVQGSEVIGRSFADAVAE